MRVGISAYLMHVGGDYRNAGLSTYVQQLVQSLAEVEPAHQYVVFHGSDAPPLSCGVSVASPVPTYRPFVRIPWEQTGLLLQASLQGIDVFHGTVNVLPLLTRWPSVLTVHDLSFLRYPERFPRLKAMYLRLAVARSVRRATRIIAVSEHTRQELVELLAAPAERVSVVYEGVDGRFRVLSAAELHGFQPATLGARPYILHVGTLEPRKNLDVLIRAFALLRRRAHIPHALALVGAAGWMFEDLFRLVDDLGLRQDVRFIGYVHPAELPLWYNCADLFAYPSAYEGFGLPVLEAMACGLPTVTTASSALKELAGDACLTIEPGSEDALAVAMARLLSDSALRATLRLVGLERAQRFHWHETARATLRVYEEAREDRR